MAWIESHTVLARHRKTLELAIDLKVKPVQIIGHLHALWHTVLEQQEDGDLSRWSDTLIAQSALWDGEPVEFVTRLRERGWLDGALIHDWIDYVGPYLTKKYSSGNVQRLKDIWAKHGYKYGKGQGKYTKQKATSKRVESERKERLPNPSLPNPSSPLLSEPDLTKPPKDCDVPSAAARVWDRYEVEYLARYKTKPVRNAKVNGQITSLIKRIGIEAAPEVAAFYVWHNDQFYVRSRHPVGLLLHAAEGLHTQWKTGVKVTTSEVKQAEVHDDAREQVKRVEAMLARGL